MVIWCSGVVIWCSGVVIWCSGVVIWCRVQWCGDMVQGAVVW